MVPSRHRVKHKRASEPRGTDERAALRIKRVHAVYLIHAARVCVRYVPIADDIARQNVISLSNREDRRWDETGEIACYRASPPLLLAPRSILLYTLLFFCLSYSLLPSHN